ncbi:MAG: hypothetical protein K0S47_4364 [Herbinix sp.]|jgi:hypothetical protein|nr:hypothetical protein [Herbinix sp.]
MSLLAIIGWVLLGAAATTILVTFWDQIRDWLNNVAADAVESVFGYRAREAMHRAIAKVDRVMDKVRSRSTIYAKKTPLDTHYVKTDIVAEAGVYQIDKEVLEEIKKKGELVQEFVYKS